MKAYQLWSIEFS